MADETKPNDPNSRLDAFVAKVTGDPANPQQTLLLSGFMGASSEAHLTRIYSDETLENYIDVANDDIVHTEPRPASESPLGGSYIWIKKDAEALYGKAGAERSKARFLEGPISAQAAGEGTDVSFAAGAVGAVAPTIQLLACHPTLVVPQCRSLSPFHCASHLPVYCPPTPLPHLCPTRPILCPPLTPVCPTNPIGCPPITIHQPQCVASGGGPGCPVDTPQTPQTPQFPGAGGIAFAAPQAAPAAQQIAPSILCPSVLWTCPSVQIWRCPTSPIFCHRTAPIVCHHTLFEPQCIPVLTANCPIVSAACPEQTPGGGIQQQAFAAPAAAAAAQPLPATQVAAVCITYAATVCCPSLQPLQCPTRVPALCPTHYHCATVNQYHCPSVAGYHCPTPHCPTPACPSAVCTEVGPHCQPTPNPVHCPTPNQICPPHTHACPSVGDICPTTSPLFCGTLPPNPGFAAPEAAAPQAAAPQAAAAHPALIPQTLAWPCGVTVNFHCGPTAVWCPPVTLHAPCFTPRCPW
ncbi:MAG: hypothetical protein JSU00_30620 [Acidobacteria bacterium]|nr:hypothetical protein [Acidobacteriota bacterium]